MKKLFLVFFLLFAIVGCATEGKFTGLMDYYKGKSVSLALTQWGAPTEFLEDESNKYYSWTRESGCNKHIVTDKNGMVVSWSSNGECVADASRPE